MNTRLFTFLRTRWPLILLIPALPLAYLAFRDIPAGALRDWAASFSVPAFLLLAVFEAAAWMVMGERWRWLCREQGERPGAAETAAARLYGFAWSYITPGPHIGGEPMQVLYLTRRGRDGSRIAAALARDRGYELLSGLLTVSFLAVLPGGDRPYGLIAAGAALAAVAAMFLLSSNRRAFRAAAAAVLVFAGPGPPRRRRWHRFLRDVFRPAARGFIPSVLLLLSLLLAPLLIVLELQLFHILSGTPLGWRRALILAAVSRIAHYAPVPAAAGVYDAGMIAAAAWLSLDPGTAAAYVLFTRLRDLLQVGAGLALGSLGRGGRHGR